MAMEDDVRYESKAVRCVRGMEGRTRSKWQQEGWEIVAESPSRLRTEFIFRRQIRPRPIRLYVLGVSVVALAVVGIVIGGVITEARDGTQFIGPSADAASDVAVSESPSPDATSRPSALSDESPVTIENSDAFAALLQNTDYCDASIAAFASSHRDQMLTFDGYIAALNLHDGAKTRYDLLLGAGDFSETSAAGPAFQFRDVNTTSDLHYSGAVPDSVGVGTMLRFTARVIEYEPNTCLFQLDPVKTTFR
jgi:hypothetical protein